MRILISPFTKPRRDGQPHAKDYPHWDNLISMLSVEHELLQIGVSNERVLISNSIFDAPLSAVQRLVNEHDLFISVDNFLPHLVNCQCPGKIGVVLFGPSDPDIFGYPQNLNLSGGHRYLRKNQFDIWERCDPDPNAFVKPIDVMVAIHRFRRYLDK